jgi:L-seryl-tRNA(Ser) seleniumtransferase
VEVGTTNRTRIADYAAALDANPGALVLRVHRSNFALVGFTEMPAVAELARLAHERKVYLLHDLGSGALDPALGELTAAQSQRDGADLVLISGDKLLGGPQAGILLGRRDLVEKCRKHALSRALRVDRMLLAALEATLRLYRDRRASELPALAAIHAQPEELRQKATRLALALGEKGVASSIVETEGEVGGGSLPLRKLPGAGVALKGDAGALLAELRAGTPAVVALLREDAVVLDVRCVWDLSELAEAVVSAAERANVRAAGPEGARLEEEETEV